MSAPASGSTWELAVSKAEDRVAEIRGTQIGASGKRALIVEGADDVAAFTQLLRRRSPNWEQAWALAPAGNKREALKMAPLEPTWLVLTDRDEWSDTEVAQHEAAHANLFVLPRFCLESYLVDPQELWLALPQKQREKPGVSLPALQTAMLANLGEWRRHAALWQVINPMWSGLRALGFKDGLLKTEPVADDTNLQQTLQSWASYVDATRVYAEVQAAVFQMNQLPQDRFLHRHLYAKDFYPQVVHRVLDQMLGAKPAKARRVALFSTLPLPGDLEPLWQRMGLA